MNNLLTAVHGKGFDHEIVNGEGHQLAKVFAWQSDSFELAQVLAASTALLAACEFYMESLRELQQGGYTLSGWEIDAYKKFRAAIAQAKGRRS